MSKSQQLNLVWACFCALSVITATADCAVAADPQSLTIFGAGTLATPFRKVNAAFEKQHPGLTIRAQFGGSVKMARQITELHQEADILAVADYSVIPKYMFSAPAHASWFAGFARNAITFVYTNKSKYANDVNSTNWFDVLSRKGVEIGRSDPNTDPSGYQIIQMLNLANVYYHNPRIEDEILANAPTKNMRDTETTLLSALQLGEIDYLAIYRSDALQHGLKYIELPKEIDLSEPTAAAYYEKGITHTKNGDIHGKPIVYAITVLKDAKHATLAEQYVAFLLGPEGQSILKRNGFGEMQPTYAVNIDRMPAALKKLVQPWPGS